MSMDWQQLLEVASEAADAGGKALSAHWRSLNQIRSKGRPGDLVTEADLAAEAAVLLRLWRRGAKGEAAQHARAQPWRRLYLTRRRHAGLRLAAPLRLSYQLAYP